MNSRLIYSTYTDFHVTCSTDTESCVTCSTKIWLFIYCMQVQGFSIDCHTFVYDEYYLMGERAIWLDITQVSSIN